MDEPRTPAAGENFDRLKALLREMFQLDRGDLDFGLYRIMNVKAAEISAFLDRDLLPQVERTLRLAGSAERQRLEAELATALADAGRFGGIDPEETDLVRGLRARLAAMKKDADAEADVYDRLAAFFARYYTEGDFVSQRRYVSGGRSAYLIPYDGEEVKLHWANADQYYVKTTENYASYVFHVGEGAAARRVRFEIAAADVEKDNVKEADGRQRRFVLAAGKSAVEVDGGALTARFEHRPLTAAEKRRWPGSGGAQQRRIDQAAAERILKAVAPDWRALLAALSPTEADPGRTVVARHVERYTARNAFDYFIHKDLGGFLRRELDLYLNTEVLNLDDLEQGDAARLDRALARLRAIRHVGRKIVDFLAQLEEFQKRLWLKKKFVLETNWCVTLDRVPEALYPEIAANAAQRAEWRALCAADEIAGDAGKAGLFERSAPPPALVADPPDVEFLKANPYLVVDTRHFDRGFADRLLEALSDAGPLDDGTDGLLVHGENFQALNLLQARYRGRVKCVYIDPPYNTESDSFLYKDGYQKSTWITMLVNRAHLAQLLMTQDGLFFMQIGDEEVARSRVLLDTIFPDRKNSVIVRRGIKNVQSQFEDITRLSVGYDTIHIYAKIPGLRIPHLKQLHRSVKDGKWDTFWRSTDRPTMRYEMFAQHPDTGQWRWEKNRALTAAQNYDHYLEHEAHSKTLDEWYVENLQAGSDLDFVRRNDKGVVQYYIPPQSHKLLSDNWLDISTAGAFSDFSTEKHISLIERIADWNTVEDDVIMDFFAGSGTTGHATINLNRSGGGKRKYILVEMGHHFDTVLLPRMKKVVHSPDWKSGKPVSRAGVSQVFKYVRLESYDDTMDNLEVAPRSAEQEALLAENAALAEDYRLRYALEAETAGSVCLLGRQFADPFAYTLATVSDGARRETPVDLPETFNWLIGLRTASRRRIDGVLAITGADAKGRNCLILWRNLDRMDAEALNAWFARNRPHLPDSLDLVYINGDHTLNGVKRPDDPWTAETLEPRFRELMFETAPR